MKLLEYRNISITESNLNDEKGLYDILPFDVIELSRLFRNNGYKLYVVGGAVRDYLLGNKPKDFDLATDAKPEQIKQIIQGKYNMYDVGEAFGITVIKTPNFKDGIEVATFRSDIGKGRRPDSVEYTDINQDVKRRDLTINALYYDIFDKKIIDLVGGIEDIKGNIVRTVGRAEDRFDEDPLRKLRVPRFAGRTLSKPDEDTKKAIQENPDLSGVSKERIRDEFIKGWSSSKDKKFYMNLLEELGLLDEIFPDVKLNKVFVDYPSKHYTHAIAYLLKDIDTNFNLNKYLNSIKYTNDDIKYIQFFINLCNIKLDSVYELRKEQQKLNIPMKEVIEFLSYHKLPIEIKHMTDAYIKYELSVTPIEVMDMGFRSADIGKEIKRLETEKFNKILNSL
jgi:tRNA nucleotidyltransferase/poly(A) polymerase